METILSLKNLDKKYGVVHAVNNLSFDIQKGNVYGILGPNGSGKSTTLGIILNVVNRTSGEFSWFNGQLSTHEALKKVGAIIERPNFYPYMTATQNLALICKIKGISTEKIDEKLATVNLFDRKDSKFSTFSLGMKQRLAIAAAMIGNPDVLIFDEPTNGLDPQGIAEVRHTINKIAQQGKTIIMASHILDEVEKICSHVAIIKNGNLLATGTVGSIISNDKQIEVSADNLEQLQAILAKNPNVLKQVLDDKILTLTTTEEMEATEINAICFQNNLTLSHLLVKKKSLEAEFLEITS